MWGQILTSRGQPEEALPLFEQALTRAEDEDRPYALHELGVALLDLDRPVDAREKLEAVLSARRLPVSGRGAGRRGRVRLPPGTLPEAQQEAEQALAQGATIPASLVLGSVALDYYHLDDALEHYQRVIREAAPGSRDWITGQQMAADVMAQQGFPDPAAAYAHAQQALEHTEASDDWHGTLQDHLTKAETLMGARQRAHAELRRVASAGHPTVPAPPAPAPDGGADASRAWSPVATGPAGLPADARSGGRSGRSPRRAAGPASAD